ncbi:MAG TPA: CpsD/CapB family tyrosine-protein kinase [Candidatus Acidoferrum sp.]|nr:CpsD/CapB family tyrosine-protein kinase [Candidatus Acidoferrum sp.]
MVQPELVSSEPLETPEVLGIAKAEGAVLAGTVEMNQAFENDKNRTVMVQPTSTSRLVAWSDPNSLGAEKFRALAVRLDDMRRHLELKSLQVTSSVINEGKSFVAANLAVTLAKYTGSKTLLIEGDLHRPTLASMFGLKDLQGLSDWWTGRNQDIARFLVRLTGTGLYLLPAGKPCDRPSEILRSAQLAEAFAQLAGRFDWIVVDSTPMLPVIDANLWSKLVDGTLLVVREGVAPLKALKNGLQSLDNPNLIGVVVNEASEFDQVDYQGQYYGARKYGDKSSKNGR